MRRYWWWWWLFIFLYPFAFPLSIFNQYSLLSSQPCPCVGQITISCCTCTESFAFSSEESGRWRRAFDLEIKSCPVRICQKSCIIHWASLERCKMMRDQHLWWDLLFRHHIEYRKDTRISIWQQNVPLRAGH